MEKKFGSILLCLILMCTSFGVSAQNVAPQRFEIPESLKLKQTTSPLIGEVFDPLKNTSPKSSPYIFLKPDLRVSPKSLEDFKSDKKSGGEGGWGSSGGGSGVACFVSVQAADAAKKYIEANEALPADLPEKIKTVEVLEYWELGDKVNDLIDTENMSADQILMQVKHNIARIVPLYMFRLEQAGTLIEVTQWNAKNNVERIFDANPKRAIPDNCAQVQLAARYAREKYKDGAGPSSTAPKVKVVFNKDFFSRMTEINKAMLILHEEIYILGLMIAHPNSEKVRDFVRAFFQKSFAEINVVGRNRSDVRQRLVYFFGDYVRYFSEEMIFQAKPYTQESRFNSFNTLISTLRKKIGMCQDGALPKEEMIEWRKDIAKHTCQDYVMNNNLIEKWIDEEGAFVYLANYILDISLGRVNSEYLIVPFAPGPLTEMAESYVPFVCGYLKSFENRFVYEELLRKGLKYCTDIRSRLSPKEKGRN